MFWPDELTKVLKTLWAQGMTGGEIAKALGLNRNAVLGKAHRVGLLGYRKPKPQGRSVVPFRKAARRPPMFQTTQMAPSPRDAGRSFNGDCGPIYDIMQLKRHNCRWPIGEPGDKNFCYCGASVKQVPYCPTHRALAYVKPLYRAR